MRACREVAGQARGELLGIFCDLVVEVDGGGMLQAVVLRVDRGHYPRVAVPHAHRHDARERLRDTKRVSARSTAPPQHSVVLLPTLPPSTLLRRWQAVEETEEGQVTVTTCNASRCCMTRSRSQTSRLA